MQAFMQLRNVHAVTEVYSGRQAFMQFYMYNNVHAVTEAKRYAGFHAPL